MSDLLNFTDKGDEFGQLIVIENNHEIPFAIQRVFYIYGTSESFVRGRHANRKSQFVLICLQGSVKIGLFNGRDAEVVTLNRPDQGLLIKSMIWKDMYEFSPDAMVLVLSDKMYDDTEYIRDLDAYKVEMGARDESKSQ